MQPLDRSALDALGNRVRAHLEADEPSRAVAEVVKQLGPELLGYLHAVLPSPHDADDVFGLYCERLMVGIERFRGDSSLRTWSYRIVRNIIIDAARSRRRSRVRPALTAEIVGIADHVRSQTATHLRTVVKDRFARMRAELPEEDRTLLVLRIDRRLPWKEVAAVMLDDTDPAAVARLRKRFTRLVARLREQLDAPP